MIGDTYILTINSSDISLTLTFNLHGRLIKLHLDGECTDAQYQYIMSNIPLCEKDVDRVFSKSSKMQLQKIPVDLSFDKFWNTYNYKVGKKKQAENIWKKMSKGDKVKALLYIRKYNYHLRMNDGIAKAYPTTYLNQEYYNQ